MRPINQRRTPAKPTAVGACQSCSTDPSRAAEQHGEKCWSQRIPIRLDIPAPTVAGGVVTPTVLPFEPDHDGDIFEVESMFITAEYVNQNDNLNDAEEVYRRSIKIGKNNYDCLSQDEQYGVPVLAYSQPDCCEGLQECIPPFGNKDNSKDVLSIEFVNAQTEIVGGVVTGRAVRLRGYIKGRCRSCGYEKLCNAASEAPAA